MTVVELTFAPSLIERMAAGDEAALGELYDRYGGVAYGLALRVLRDPGLAEDAVQEAFLQAWRGARDYRPERAKEATWLLMLVHRRAVDSVRRRQRRSELPYEQELHDGEALPFELAVDHRRIRSALDDLPPDERVAIELAYFEAMTQSEIAAALAVPLGTVKSRTMRGLTRLRELLATER